MMRLAKTWVLVAGLALIALSNAVPLLGVAYNRSGTPDSSLTLTERELMLPYRFDLMGENSGISLRLAWRVESQKGSQGSSYNDPWSHPIWLDNAKLQALGFALPKPVKATGETGLSRLKVSTRDVYLVLEYDGEAYQRSLETGQEGNNSRLFVVDAGLDADALRRQYPDGSHYLILQGQVILLGNFIDKDESPYTALIRSLSIEQITIPMQYRKVLEPLLADNNGLEHGAEPRYSVMLNVGKRHEPWVTEINLLEPKE